MHPEIRSIYMYIYIHARAEPSDLSVQALHVKLLNQNIKQLQFTLQRSRWMKITSLTISNRFRYINYIALITNCADTLSVKSRLSCSSILRFIKLIDVRRLRYFSGDLHNFLAFSLSSFPRFVESRGTRGMRCIFKSIEYTEVYTRFSTLRRRESQFSLNDDLERHIVRGKDLKKPERNFCGLV